MATAAENRQALNDVVAYGLQREKYADYLEQNVAAGEVRDYYSGRARAQAQGVFDSIATSIRSNTPLKWDAVVSAEIKAADAFNAAHPAPSLEAAQKFDSENPDWQRQAAEHSKPTKMDVDIRVKRLAVELRGNAREQAPSEGEAVHR